MKKNLAITTVLTMSLVMTGCSNGGSAAADDKEFSVGFALNSMDEANKKMMTFMEKHFEEAGVELIVADAGGSVDQQITDVENFMTLGVDVIAVKAIDSGAMTDVCQQAADTGITIVNYIAGLNTECVNFGYDLYHFDDAKVEYLINYLEENPEEELKIGYIWGSKSMEACQSMYKGFTDRIKESPVSDRIEIVVEADAEWAADNAITTVEDWLQAYPEINCITSMSDTLVCAATEALRAGGMDFDDYIIIGNDGTEDAVAKIRSGELEGSVYVDQNALTKAFLQACEDIRDGKVTMGDEVLFTDYLLITAENVDDYFE